MALAAPSPSTIKLTTFIDTGLTSPVLITSAHDGTGRLFVVQQNGVDQGVHRRRLAAGHAAGRQEPGLGRQRAGPPRPGLPPRLQDQPQVLRELHEPRRATRSSASTRRRRRTPTGSRPAPAGRSSRSTSRSRTTTAATLAFGPGGYLYIGMGDGGSGGDPGNRAQDTGKLLGKMLRIDVNGTSGKKHYRIPASNPYVGRPGATRSGCAASATRGATRSTRRPTACGSATSARAGTRRSIASRRPRRAPTWAGGRSRATPATTRRATATRRARSSRSSPTRTPAVAARSPAATCTAARTSRR